MAKLGIVTGLAFEAKIARSCPRGDFQLEVLCLGPGPENAREAAETLVEAGATALMSFGVAGALEPGLRAGDLVIGTRVITQHHDRFGCHEDLSGILQQRSGASTGDVMGADQPIQTIEEKQDTFRMSRALAVDMESHAIAAVAHRADLPLIVARAIVDPAHQQLPSCVLAGAKPGGELNLPGFFWRLVQRPGELADVIRLARQNKRAQQALRDLALFGLPHLFRG